MVDAEATAIQVMNEDLKLRTLCNLVGRYRATEHGGEHVGALNAKLLSGRGKGEECIAWFEECGVSPSGSNPPQTATKFMRIELPSTHALIEMFCETKSYFGVHRVSMRYQARVRTHEHLCGGGVSPS